MDDGAKASSPVFPATRWSVVLRAQQPESSGERREALAELCRLYWYPLYAFARREGWSPEDAEDHAQAFFVRLLETDLFRHTGSERGRLRTFLLTAFRHDLADAHRSMARLKRGGRATFFSINRAQAEERLQSEAPLQIQPENAFDRHWALSVLAASMDRLAGEYAAAGREKHFGQLRHFLGFSEGEPAGYEGLAGRLELSPAGARQAVHRLRERFRLSVRSHIADTLAAPDERQVDLELEALRHALAA